MHTFYRGEHRDAGVSGIAQESNPLLRDSKALSEEPSRIAVALIQLFPNACDYELSLGRKFISSRG